MVTLYLLRLLYIRKCRYNNHQHSNRRYLTRNPTLRKRMTLRPQRPTRLVVAVVAVAVASAAASTPSALPAATNSCRI